MLKEILIEIKNSLQKICSDESKKLPELIYAKEITKNYPINLNKATEFCKLYGINFGGWCIESTKFKEILHNARGNLFE